MCDLLLDSNKELLCCLVLHHSFGQINNIFIQKISAIQKFIKSFL